MTIPNVVFKIGMPTMVCSRDEVTGRRRIEGIASSTVVDSHGDEITLQAQRKMVASALGLTIFMNHSYSVPEDVFGGVTKADLVKTGETDPKTGKPIYDMRFGIDVADSNPRALSTWELLASKKTKLGISIGAMIPEGGATFNKAANGFVIDDIDLVEASIVGVPANQRSFVDYAVKAMAGRFPDTLDRGTYLEKMASDLAGEPVVEESDEEGETVEEVAKALEQIALMTDAPDPAPRPEEGVMEYEFDEAHFSGEPTLIKESWSSAYKASLPDSAFACPKSRKFPHHTKSGAVDRSHVVNALQRQAQDGNDQCGHAHLEAHAKALKIGEKDLDPVLVKSGSGQHPHAHLHNHEHEHGYGSSKVVHDHEHAHVHSHAHDADHDHADDMNNYQHEHSHAQDGSWEGNGEHPHDESGDTTVAKSRVTIWESEDGKVVEVNTGRTSKSDSSQSAQDEPPDTAGGSTGEGGSTKDVGDLTVLAAGTKALDNAGSIIKSLSAQLKAARTENTDLREQNRQLVEVSTSTIKNAGEYIRRVGLLPAGRETGYAAIKDGMGEVADVYGEDVKKILRKSATATATRGS